MEGFCSELGVSEDEALNLIGRSVAIAKEARKQHTSQKVKILVDSQLWNVNNFRRIVEQ